MAQPSLPQGNEQRLRCLHCNKIKSFQNDNSKLSRHTEQKHPEIKLNRKPEHKLASKHAKNSILKKSQTAEKADRSKCVDDVPRHGITKDCLAKNSILKKTQTAEKADRLKCVDDVPRHGITEDCLAKKSILKKSQTAEKADRLKCVNDVPRHGNTEDCLAKKSILKKSQTAEKADRSKCVDDVPRHGITKDCLAKKSILKKSQTAEKADRLKCVNDVPRHGNTEDCLAKKSILKKSQTAEKADRLKWVDDVPRITVHWRNELVKGKKTPTAACNVSATKDHLCLCAKEKAKSIRNQLYKEPILQWSALDGKIFCPACGCKRCPLIKAASELETGWLANCWPLCLLPCLMSSDNREYLYCSKCKTFLGIYHREYTSVRLKKEFVVKQLAE
ncbi:uncharacterized protein LOC108137067 isoform X2 [Drosophila elegans]|uniref:uncharacterized protein LOC108137067 isoform X2 n=1 Tax=Drosophila elegans TaxID=30023 RepID=UPI001BC83320|nr:uncharacterized protein LOC108137067 isoform X2 [Drosophila elegans]